MKLKATIVSLISVLLAGAVGIGLYCAWPAIHGTITDEKYYTAEELKNSYIALLKLTLGKGTGCGRIGEPLQKILLLSLF